MSYYLHTVLALLGLLLGLGVIISIPFLLSLYKPASRWMNVLRFVVGFFAFVACLAALIWFRHTWHFDGARQ